MILRLWNLLCCQEKAPLCGGLCNERMMMMMNGNNCNIIVPKPASGP